MAHPILIVVLAAGVALFNQKPQDEIVLLPGPDGKVGEVVVSKGNEQAVLKSAYASAATGSGSIQTGASSEAEVRANFGQALAAQPPRPVSFTLYFESGGNTLTAESEKTLNNILAEIAKRPSPEITAIGHTDTMGDGNSNDALSKQRAEEVKNILTTQGIPATSITTAGRGERELLVRTPDNVDEPRNRRVEVNIR